MLFSILALFSVTIILEVKKMKRKIELLFFVLAITYGWLTGVLLADITSDSMDVSALGDYANEYRVDADQPENTNNCTMNDMEGSKAPDTILEDPNTLAAIAPTPFVEDVWRPDTPVSNSNNPYNPRPIPDPNPDPNPDPPDPATPEPATVLVFCAGMCGLLSLTRRKRLNNITK
jgi:hypothetical protein